MYSMPVRTVWTFLTSPLMQWPAYMLPSVESSQPGTKIGRFFSRGGEQPAVLRVDLVVLLELARKQDLVEELVREVALRPCASAATHSSSTALSMRRMASSSGMQVSVTRFMWRVEQRLLVLGGQVAVVRHALVVVVRHEVEDVLLEIGAGAADGVDLVLADHLGEREAELGGAHGAGERHQHLAALLEVAPVGVGRVDERRGVEVPVMVMDEFADLAHD